MNRRILLSLLASGTILGFAGCRHCCNKPFREPPRPYLPPPPGGAFIGGPTRTIPPTGVPTTPAPVVVPSDPGFPPPNLGAPPREGGFRPPQPFVPKSGPELLFPESVPLPKNGSIAPAGGQTSEPPLTNPPAAGTRPEQSAELPQYLQIKDGVAAGMRPTTQGFAELKQRGFKTVAFLHAPGASTSAEKEMVEKQGMTFTAIETAPENLAEALTKVNAMVADKSQHPAYFFANDARGGAVWYLHMRTVDNASDDLAKVRASGLGLTDADTAYWVAIQAILAKR